MVQIIQSGPSERTLRQQAFENNIQNALGAWSQLNKEQQANALTERQQALQEMELTQNLQKQGFDVSQGDVKAYLTPEKKKGFMDVFKEFATGEKFQQQERPDLFSKRTQAWIDEQAQAKKAKEMQSQKAQNELESSQFELDEKKNISPIKRRQLEQQIKASEFDLQEKQANAPLQRQKTQAEIAKMNSEASKAQTPLNARQRLDKVGGETQGKVGGIASGIRALSEMRNAISQGEGPSYIDANTPFVGKALSDNQYTKSERVLSEVVGRLQSGGAIGKDEEARFVAMGPRPGDSKEVRLQKLNDQMAFLENKLTGFGFSTKDLNELGFDVGNNPVQQKEHDEAISWARANINDPRAQQILKMNGV